MRTLSKIFTFLMGDLWTVISAILTTTVSYFLFPVFIETLKLNVPFSGLLSFFAGVFAIGFLLSSVGNAISLFVKASKVNVDNRFKKSKWQITKKWGYVALGIIVILLDILVVILGVV